MYNEVLVKVMLYNTNNSGHIHGGSRRTSIETVIICLIFDINSGIATTRISYDKSYKVSLTWDGMSEEMVKIKR